MKKHLLIAATAALLAWPNLSSRVMAAPPQATEETGTHHPQLSPEDFAAFTDARIAALRAGLKLTPAQEQYWPALETALREQAKARAARMAEWWEKTKEPREHRSAIESLQQGAKRLAARSAELEKLASAAKPLYDSLDDAQKRRFGPLLHMATGRHWHHGHEGFRHGENFE
jgi:zinc resistance-associated protein